MKAQYDHKNPLSKKKIIIIGAGLAGLKAADELLKMGHEPVVLEGRDSPGGRVFTIREPFDDLLHADAGGFRIRETHERVLAEAKRFRLPLVHFYPARGQFIDIIEQSRFVRRRGELVSASRLPRPFTVEERSVFAHESDTEMYKIAGGADLLPRAFAAELGSRVHYNSRVVAIDHDAGRARVHVQHSQGARAFDGDLVICTVPLSVIYKINFTPPLPPSRRDLIARTPYTPTSLVYLQFKKQYWRAGGFNGFGMRDGELLLWNASHERPDGRGILILFFKGGRSREIAAMDLSLQIETALAEAELLLPGARAHFERGAAHSWNTIEWSEGAQSRVWELTIEEQQKIREPLGRILFAGEHAARSDHGWMEGALESGERAARECYHFQ